MVEIISIDPYDWTLIYKGKNSPLRVLIAELEKNFSYRYLSRLMGYGKKQLKILKRRNTCKLERLLKMYEVYEKLDLKPPILLQDAVIQANKIVRNYSWMPIEKYVKEMLNDNKS